MSKEKTAAITKITLTIGKREFTLTPEEIKDLKHDSFRKRNNCAARKIKR